MIKGLLIYINIIFLSAISFFAGDEVTLSSNVPLTAKAGETFEISLTVNKGDIKGVAKIQYAIPAGAQASVIDAKGGDFKVNNDMMKITWMGMPNEASFTVKFKVTTTPQTSGLIALNGKFAYTVNGESKDVYFTQSTINFSAGAVVANTNSTTTTTTPATTTTTTTSPATTTTSTTTTTTPVTNTTTATTNTPTNTTTTTATTSTPAMETTKGAVTAKRVLSATSVKNGGSFTVEITVSKNDVTGYAKIQDNLPVGFTAEEVDSYGGQFTVEDGKVKILWMTIPSAAVFKVKYKVTVDNKVTGKQKIDGFFSYLPDQTSDTKVNIGISEIMVGGEAVATTTATTTNNPATSTTTTTTSEPVATTTTPKNTDTEKTPAKTTASTTTTPAVKVIEKEKPSTTSTTASTTTKKTKVNSESTTESSSTPAVVNNPGATNSNQELYYSVQICALKKAVDVSYFEKNNSVKEKIYVQMHEGWHKYTVGEFSVYKEARDHRETVKAENKIVGPFVTAYNKGIRITVQEALMISKQQWVQ